MNPTTSSRHRRRATGIFAAAAVVAALGVAAGPAAQAHEVATPYPLDCEMTGLDATFTTSHVPTAGVHAGMPATITVGTELTGGGHAMPVSSVELTLGAPELFDTVDEVTFSGGNLTGSSTVDASGDIELTFTGSTTSDRIDLPTVTIEATIDADAELGARAILTGPAAVVLDGGETDTCTAADGPAPILNAGVVEHSDGDHGHGDGDGGEDGPIISIDDPRLTAEQRQRAQALLDETREAMEAFPDVAAVEAAGYITIGDGRSGFEHFVNYQHVASPETLDPEAIESIVFEVSPDGSKRPVSAMYIMGPGSTMEDVPEIAGELTTWHDHQDLCWEGNRVVGLYRDGACRPAGELRTTPPMLHVWLEDQPCGPFAGIEGTHGDGCDHGEHPHPSPTTTTTTVAPTTTTTVAPTTTSTTTTEVTTPPPAENPGRGLGRAIRQLIRAILGLFR